jgi:hypothetical protein
MSPAPGAGAGTSRRLGAPGRAGWLAWLAPALLLLVLLWRWGGAVADPGLLLDNTRQYGPPLVARLHGDGWLAAQPQIHYFSAAAPRLYQGLVLALAGGLGLTVPVATKLLGLGLLLPLAALAWGLARALLVDPAQRALLAVLLVANVIFSNQMLTGTPRDLGTLLFFALLLAWIEGRWLASLLALGLLAAAYPTFGVLGLLACAGALLLAALAARERVPAWRLLALLLVTLVGLRLLGPQIDAASWGPTFRLFDPSHFGAAGPLDPGLLAGGAGPSVASLAGFRPSPVALLELLGDKRFRPLPASGEHAFGWLADPATLLLLAVVVAAIRLGPGLRRAGPAALLAPWRAWRAGDPGRRRRASQLGLALAVVAPLLYGLSFAVAFRLHDPNRYLMMPAVLLLSAADYGLLAWLLRRRGGWLLPLLLALALPLLRPPVDLLPVEAATIKAVAGAMAPAGAPAGAGAGSPQAGAQLLVLPGARAADLASALPVAAGVRVYYAEELDRGFQRQAIRDGLRLRRSQELVVAAVQRADPGLPQRLRQLRVSHLLGSAAQLAPLAPRPACTLALSAAPAGLPRAGPPEPLQLLNLACQFPDPARRP